MGIYDVTSRWSDGQVGFCGYLGRQFMMFRAGPLGRGAKPTHGRPRYRKVLIAFEVYETNETFVATKAR